MAHTWFTASSTSPLDHQFDVDASLLLDFSHSSPHFATGYSLPIRANSCLAVDLSSAGKSSGSFPDERRGITTSPSLMYRSSSLYTSGVGSPGRYGPCAMCFAHPLPQEETDSEPHTD